MSKKGIWITWEKQIRNKGISSALGWELFEIVYHDNRLVRYSKCLIKTLKILMNEKPDYVAAQNPSIILALAIVLLKPFFRYTYIIDAHNSGLLPLEGRNKALNIAAKILQRLSDWTIVTNLASAEIVNHNKGKAVVLPDRLPQPYKANSVLKLDGKINLAFICSFSLDEPYKEVIEAAKSIPDDIYIYITGRYKNKIEENDLPPNVKLLGYVPDNQYWALISSVDGIMVLTTRENCLVCGAYEAVSLKKPMILSNTRAITTYFRSGSIYAEPNVDSIKDSIFNFIVNKDRLSEEIIALKESLITDWQNCFSNFKKVIRIH